MPPLTRTSTVSTSLTVRARRVDTGTSVSVPTDAAGAVADGDSAARARHQGLDPRAHLDRNDSHPVFAALGDLVGHIRRSAQASLWGLSGHVPIVA